MKLFSNIAVNKETHKRIKAAAKKSKSTITAIIELTIADLLNESTEIQKLQLKEIKSKLGGK